MSESDNRRKLSPRKKRYARARGRGQTMAEAAAAAGYTGTRARKSVTGSELERDPRVLMAIQEEIRKSMDEAELDGILAAQARGQVPTKVVNGTGARAEYDTHAAASTVARCMGKFKDAHVGAGGGPILHDHRFSEMTDEELKRRLAEKGAEAGVQVRTDG